MARPTAMDEYFVHQIPELLPSVAVHHHHWRESYFYELHDPSGDGDAIFFTMAHYPAQERMDSLQMGRVGGRQMLGLKGRPYGGDPHTTMVPGARRCGPFHRGGLNLMRVSTADGRRGTAMYEITGARHHHFFPDTVVEGALPA